MLNEAKSLAVSFSNTVNSIFSTMPKEVEYIALTAIGSAIGMKFPRLVLLFGSLYIVGRMFEVNQGGYVIQKKSQTEV